MQKSFQELSDISVKQRYEKFIEENISSPTANQRGINIKKISKVWRSEIVKCLECEKQNFEINTIRHWKKPM